MSITTSQEERDQAVEKIEAKTDAQLREDLSFWAIAVADHNDTYNRLTSERAAAVDLFQEAQAWVSIIVQQLQKRRRPLS